MVVTIRRNAANGLDSAELSVLYARYWDMVVAYLRGQGARDPEDVASEVFVGVLRNVHRFEGDEAAFRSWILVIAHRRLVDQRRVQARRPTDAVDPLRLVPLSDRQRAGNVEDEAISRLSMRRVVQALSVLTDEQRAVVLMHTVGDLSLPQIAETLGKRLPAVKSLHHRGLAAAARALGDPSHWRQSEAG